MNDIITCHALDPDCNQCGKPIYWKAKSCFQNKLWHKECFKCINCFISFDNENEATPNLSEDGYLRCNLCFQNFECKKNESRKKKYDGKRIMIDWNKVKQQIETITKSKIQIKEENMKDITNLKGDESGKKEKEKGVENIYIEEELIKKEDKKKKVDENNKLKSAHDQGVKLTNKIKVKKDKEVIEKKDIPNLCREENYETKCKKIITDDKSKFPKWTISVKNKNYQKKKIPNDYYLDLNKRCNCKGCKNFTKMIQEKYNLQSQL